MLVTRLHKVAGKNEQGRIALGLATVRPPGKTIAPAAVQLTQAISGQDMTLEDQLTKQFSVLDLPPYERNFQFLGEQLRKYELDWAWPQFKFGLEVDGMVHRTKGRFKSDYDKHVLAILHCWTVLRVNGAHVRSGHVAAWVTTMMERYGQGPRR